MSAEIAELLPLLTGPASSVGICLLVGWHAYKLIVEKILPQHDAQFEKLMSEHGADREAFKSAIVLLDNRLEKVEQDVTYIKKKVGA